MDSGVGTAEKPCDSCRLHAALERADNAPTVERESSLRVSFPMKRKL
jgi:hypothetical protein